MLSIYAYAVRSLCASTVTLACAHCQRVLTVAVAHCGRRSSRRTRSSLVSQGARATYPFSVHGPFEFRNFLLDCVRASSPPPLLFRVRNVRAPIQVGTWRLRRVSDCLRTRTRYRRWPQNPVCLVLRFPATLQTLAQASCRKSTADK